MLIYKCMVCYMYLKIFGWTLSIVFDLFSLYFIVESNNCNLNIFIFFSADEKKPDEKKSDDKKQPEKKPTKAQPAPTKVFIKKNSV